MFSLLIQWNLRSLPDTGGTRGIFSPPRMNHPQNAVTNAMGRLIVSALVVLVLGACSGRPTGVPERDLQWRTSLRGEELRVIVFDRTGEYRIDSISLVGPNGQVLPAREITRESQGGTTGPGYSVF